MSEFNFKSSVCTSREQSERLLALGLKKETADMSHRYSNIGGNYEESVFPYSSILALKERMNKPILGRGWEELYGRDIPAWSLGRLLELIKHSDICHYNDFGCIKLYIDLDDFETCITMILYMVKEGYFNKEYLEE